MNLKNSEKHNGSLNNNNNNNNNNNKTPKSNSNLQSIFMGIMDQSKECYVLKKLRNKKAF